MSTPKDIAVDVDEAELAVFAKKLKQLAHFHGRGTELITLYLPPGVDRSQVTSQLSQEMSQSSNIKSQTTRKNVGGALRKIDGFLKQIDWKLPTNGLVVFSGNVSPVEGRTDIRLFTIKPPLPLKTKLYWCDSEFHLDPLTEMNRPKEVYGMITMDKNEATIALLQGKKYEIVGHFTSAVAGKTRAGGQCLASDTLVPLANGDIVEIKETHNPLTVLSGDLENQLVTESIITDKWESEKQPLVIVTKSPRYEISASQDHVFFVLEKGETTEKKASELRAGDRLLFPERIRVQGKEQILQTHFFNSYRIRPEGRKLLKNRRMELDLHQKELARRLGVTQTAISGIELGKRDVRHDLLFQYLSAVGLEFGDFLKAHAKEKQLHTLPPVLDRRLAQIIGYWMGDGNTEKERVCFSEQESEVAAHYTKTLRTVFNTNVNIRHRTDKGYYQIRAYGKPLVKFLQSEFPEKHSARDSEIPKKILRSPDAVVAGFLHGIFDAEGYVSRPHLGFGINNQKLARQIQLVLLRFGIVASLHEYDNRRNPYTKNHRFTIQISEKESLKTFREKIGFTSGKKAGMLDTIIASHTAKSSVRQLPVSGQTVRRIIETHGWKKQRFVSANMFLQDRRKISKEAFRQSIVEKTGANPGLQKALDHFLEYELLPAEISSIRQGDRPIAMTDISVQNQNFVAGGLIVHNSSQRFEHLREEAAKDFYRKISEKSNMAFLPVEDKLKGMIIGGPGITKQYFLNRELLDHRLRNKILAILDVAYTDEFGIRELVQKSQEILRDTDLMKETAVVNSFLEQVAKGGLATYGEKHVMDALEHGQVKTVLVSESIDELVHKARNTVTGEEREIFTKPDEDWKSAGGFSGTQWEKIDETDYLDWLVEKAHRTGADVKVVSTDTPEGSQFFAGFGGIGAILRYKPGQ